MAIYNKTAENTISPISISILSNDRIGLVSEFCSAISDCGADIRGHRAKVYKDDKGRQLSQFRADVLLNGAEVNGLLHRLHRIKGVISVNADDLN